MLNSSQAIPIPGQCFGKSMNWHYVALRASSKNGEKCEHLDIDKIIILMSPINDHPIDNIKFKVTCSLCDTPFPKTSDKLTAKFIKFYGL